MHAALAFAKRSGATSAEPVVPNSRVTVPVVRRTESPRHFSVYTIDPSGRNAISQGLDSPDATTVRVSVGTTVEGGGGGGGGGGEASVPGEDSAPVSVSLQEASRAAAWVSESDSASVLA